MLKSETTLRYMEKVAPATPRRKAHRQRGARSRDAEHPHRHVKRRAPERGGNAENGGIPACLHDVAAAAGLAQEGGATGELDHAEVGADHDTDDRLAAAIPTRSASGRLTGDTGA